MPKHFLVTGGTSGIGRAVVEEVADKHPGSIIFLVYKRDEEAAADIIATVSSKGSEAIALKFDMSDRGNIDKLVEAITAHTQHLDSIVLNIGIGTYKKYLEYEFEDWDNIIETNLTIPVFLIQRLLKAGFFHDSSVVLIGSLAGILPYSSSVVYSISKSGLIFASKVLVKELEPFKSRINVVAPGFIETRWQNDRTSDSYERINKKIALHRFGNPSEVAHIAVSVLNNTYMNGSVIPIDGGYDYY